MRKREQSKLQWVPQQSKPHRGDSIVLHFAEVDLSSGGSAFDRLIGGFVQALQGLAHVVAIGNASEGLDRSE